MIEKMRTFDEYFEIFFVKHLKDKNFPLIEGFELDMQKDRRQSILSMREYFEDFWNEAAKNASNEKYEKKIADLEEKIESLEEIVDFYRNESQEKSSIL